MAKNIFLDPLNDRELMSSFGVEQDDAPLTPEELAQMSTPEPIKEIAPTPVNAAKITPKQQESDNIQNPDVRQALQALNRRPKDSESPQAAPSQLPDIDITGQKPETELERLERMLSESRKSDRMLKIGGAIGDALATIINARSQMGAKVPGVQVQQGAGLGKVAEMFATAPEIQSDVAAKREAMLRQYAELAKGQRSQASIASREKIAEERNKALKEAASIGASRSNENLEFRKKEAEYNKVVKLQESFNKDKQVIKAEERLASAKTMRDFLADNNPIGAEAAKRFAARASGEVGTLTDQDVSVFGGSKALLDRLQQATQELATGTLTENNRKFMLQLADTFEKAGQRDLQDRLNIFSKQGTKRSKLSEDEVKEIIRPDLVLQEKPTITKPQTILRRDPKSKRTVEYDAQTKKPIRFVD